MTWFKFVVMALIILIGVLLSNTSIYAQCPPSAPGVEAGGGGSGGGGGTGDPCEKPDDDPKDDDEDGEDDEEGDDDDGDDEDEDDEMFWYVHVFNPSDPNDITGPDGYDILRWVSVNETMPFRIRFENDPVFATAPAVRVEVFCPIDPLFDITQFRLGTYGFNGMLFEVPPNSVTYSTRLDLSEEMDILVDVIGGINIVTREAFWIFQSIDPFTGLPITDVDRGFLPVKDTTYNLENDTLGIGIPGDGFVHFSIRPSPSAQTRDTVVAWASIVFDTEEEILTNVEVHTIDAYPPVSSILPLPDTSIVENPLLTFVAVDDPTGCGVMNLDLYVSVNMAPYILYAQGLTDTAIMFNGIPGNHYRFFTRARDYVHNIEAKTMADTETVIAPTACRIGDPCYVDIYPGNFDEFCQCLPHMQCPVDITLCPVDTPIMLSGGMPEGGLYGGPGVSAGYFDPAEAGKGVHSITYTFTDPLNEDHVCEFSVSVRSPVVQLTLDNNSIGTLREVIDCALEGDTILFHISLTDETVFLLEEILIQKTLVIQGLGKDALTLSGDNFTRIFHLVDGKTLALRNIALTNTYDLIQGGAILVEGYLILEDVLFENNMEGTEPKAFTVVPGATVEIRGVVELNDE